MTTLLELRGVGFGFGAKADILHEVTLALAEHERLFIVGANGAGKSTLLQLLVGLLSPTSGDVVAFGQVRKVESDFHEVRQLAGLMFQDPDDQLFCPTVAEEVAFGPLNQGRSRSQAKALVSQVLAELAIAHLAGRITYRLSGGEKRLVALACVLAMQPRVLLLDEPSTGLDDDSGERLINVLERLPQAMIVVSHDNHLRQRLATRALRLANGRLHADSTLMDWSAGSAAHNKPC